MASVAVLHPGEMGAAVGAALRGSGHSVRWAAEDRSAATARRAEAAGLQHCATLGEALDGVEAVFSVCPPAAAEDVAAAVARAGFDGLYVDANAISPARMRRIAGRFDAAVDGGIIGPPPRQAGTTRLYLSGPRAADAASLLDGAPLGTVVLDGPLGAACGLKLAYASFTKISAALAAQARALAAAAGVSPALEAELAELGQLASARRVTGVAGRAWRWAPEMREIADACRDAGLPDQLALGAAELFAHWDGHRDSEPASLRLDDLLAELLGRRAAG